MPAASSMARRIVRVGGAVVIVFPASLWCAWQLFFHWFAPPDALGMPPLAWSNPASAVTASEPLATAPGGFDDAGRWCHSDDMRTVELRVQTDDVEFIGHAFIHTPGTTAGFRTEHMDIGLIDWLNPLSATLPGHTRSDTDHAYNYVIRYRACRETVALLEASMERHARDPYQVGDWNGGRNCATWARERLMDAGFRVPEGNCPNRLARSMTPVGKLASQAAPPRS